jgi:two-component system alkaline phosphatase synthesis response regulator PhoP
MKPMAKILLLIVEDEMSLAEMYADRFKQAGFEVDIAHDGEEGLNKMATEHPSAVLMDIVMPGLSGTEAVEKAKKNPATRNIPIVMLTNFADSIDLKNAMQLGANDYIIKSELTPVQVVEKIQILLGINSRS